MDKVFPQIQDGHPSRTIRSQEPAQSEAEGFILREGAAAIEGPPVSYGCVVGKLYLFKGEKSRNATGVVLN